MKKILALTLALCLLCGAIAFADTTIDHDSATKAADMVVTLSLEGVHYTVTIPEHVGFAANGNAYTAEAEVEVKCNQIEGDCLQIAISGAGVDDPTDEGEWWRFYLNSSTNQLTYKIEVEEQGQEGRSDVYGGRPCMEVGNGEAKTFALYFTVDGELDDIPSGEYTSTLTFNVTEVSAVAE